MKLNFIESVGGSETLLHLKQGLFNYAQAWADFQIHVYEVNFY